MLEIALVAVIYYLVGLLVLGFLGLRLTLASLSTSLVALLGLILLAGINFEYDIISQKFASEFAFDIYMGRESERSQAGFFLQYLYCLPAFAITGVWWAAIGTNIAIVVLLFVVIAQRNFLLALCVFSPAMVNFAVFSLRDPIIAALAFAGALHFMNPSLTRRIGSQAVLSGMYLMIRPENVAVTLAALGTDLVRRNRKKAWVLIAAPIVLLAAILLLPIIPRLLGISFSGSIFDLPLAISNFYEARANRWGDDFGGSSNIMGGRLTDFPFFIRFPIQLTAFFIMPLPFELDNAALAVAAVDSIFFCVLAYKLHKTKNMPILVLFWTYAILVALFLNNYGNGFRLRLPAYAIILAGLYRR